MSQLQLSFEVKPKYKKPDLKYKKMAYKSLYLFYGYNCKPTKKYKRLDFVNI